MNAIIDNKIISIEYSPNKRLVIEYGIRQIENQTPYFYIIAEMYNGMRMGAFGCLHAEIEEHAAEKHPEVVALLKWHLCHITGAPMHYLDNSMYFLDSHFSNAVFDNIVFSNFKNCCVFGECVSDDETLEAFEKRRNRLMIMDDDVRMESRLQLRNDVREWLIGRMPELKTKFKTAMKTAGLKMQSE